MAISTVIAIFFIIWWVVLFAVLPWGVRSQHESGEVAPGTDPGAPAMTHLPAKLVWTTVVSAALFGACYGAYVSKAVDLEKLATLWGLLR
jgi:predicted secreted protein